MELISIRACVRDAGRHDAGVRDLRDQRRQYPRCTSSWCVSAEACLNRVDPHRSNCCASVVSFSPAQKTYRELTVNGRG